MVCATASYVKVPERETMPEMKQRQRKKKKTTGQKNDHTNFAGRMNVTRHDANFAFAWLNDSGAVWSDEPRFGAVEMILDFDHVQLGNAFGDTDNERNLSLDRRHNCLGSSRRRNVNHGCVWICVTFGLREKNRK